MQLCPSPTALPAHHPPPRHRCPAQITGTWGKVQHSFDQAAALFEKGKRDDFVVRVPDCGALHALRVWHDGSGFGSDW